MELSVIGQILVMAYTFIFSMNSIMCIAKFFHKRPLSNLYDTIQVKFHIAYTILISLFNFGYVMILISLATSNQMLLLYGIIVSSIGVCAMLFIAAINFLLWSVDAVSDLHKRLGKRN